MNTSSGMHGWYFSGDHPISGTSASERVLDALSCAKGPICYRVFVKGPIVYQYRRFQGSSRKSIRKVDCTEILEEFVASIYKLLGIYDLRRKSYDLCMNAWLSAIDVSGRVSWEILNTVLEDLVNKEMNKKKGAR